MKQSQAAHASSHSLPHTLIKHEFERLCLRSCLPKSYAFVKKGDVYVTRKARQLTSEAGVTLYVIYNTKTLQREGLGCPHEIFAAVQAKATETLVSRQEAVLAKDKKDIQAVHGTLMRLFPRIPAAVAEIVLKHGFQKGSGRVGRSTVLDFDRKVTLAVVAHARHKCTPYDDLLRQARKNLANIADARGHARQAITEQLQEVLKSWRAVLVGRRNPEAKQTTFQGQKDNSPVIHKAISSNTGRKGLVLAQNANP